MSKSVEHLASGGGACVAKTRVRPRQKCPNSEAASSAANSDSKPRSKRNAAVSPIDSRSVTAGCGRSRENIHQATCCDAGSR